MYHIEIERASGWERIDGRNTLDAAQVAADEHQTASGAAVRVIDNQGRIHCLLRD